MNDSSDTPPTASSDASMNRRDFVKRTAAAGVGLSLAGPFAASSAAGANDRVVVGVMGVNSRGNALARAFARTDGAEVGYVCDVDGRAVTRTVADVSGAEGAQERQPSGAEDVRRVLEDDAVDALVIAAPDHWHAPAAIMALNAGKHVYVEKPSSHNPREGEMLVEAQRQHPDLVVQMGNQQRSSPRSIEAVRKIRDGIIGTPYYGRAWYANARGPTTFEAPAATPDWLNYELWQGPAPRRDYRGNLVHYNWHWLWHYGTGEICNNGTHEIDVCRWALDVGLPTKVTSTGGRYHYDDDWEAFDTQVASFEFGDAATITWEGRSCNANPVKGGAGMPGGGRGASIHGTEGTLIVDRGGYVVYDNDDNLIDYANEAAAGRQVSGTGTVGAGALTDRHVANFVAAVRGEEAPRSPIEEGNRSVLLCHLGNIAQRTGRTLEIDPDTGRPTGAAEEAAMRLWGRSYADGWAPKV